MTNFLFFSVISLLHCSCVAFLNFETGDIDSARLILKKYRAEIAQKSNYKKNAHGKFI